MGSKTYELLEGEAEWPYPGKPSFVFTRQDIKTNRDDVTFVSDPVENVVRRLRCQEFQHVWLVGGGELIRSFLAQGLIDEHIISFLPLELLARIPLFPPPNPQQLLELISSQQFESGLI